MTDKKKAWVEPELIVLVGNQPEEAVLAACKLWNVRGDPNSVVFQCQSPSNICGSACNDLQGG